MTVQYYSILLNIAYVYSRHMSKDTPNAEAAWKTAAEVRYVTGIKNGKATVETKLVHPQGDEPVCSREKYVKCLENANVLTMLRAICEDQGHTKSTYAGRIRTAFYAIDMLKKLMLIEERRDPCVKYDRLYPTEAGRSLYTGVWYAMHNLAMVPKMEAFDLMIPPAFWTNELFVLRESGYDAKFGFYRLVDAEDEKRALTIHDVFADPDGRLWFTPSSANCRCKIDIDDELDTLDEETQRLLRKIIEESAEIEKERVADGYKGLMGYTVPPEDEDGTEE